MISWQICLNIQYLLICQLGADVMNSVIYYLLIGVIAYFLGSIPVAYIVAKAVRNIDVRKAGEGNVGARNVFHTVGPRWGSLVFLLDFAKGAVLAVIVSNESPARIAFAGILLLVGHGFPVWLRFIGGKGLSPVGGFTAALLPYSALIAIAISGLTWLKTRKFMPTTVTVIIFTIALAPIFEYQLEKMLIPIGLFILVGLKRKIDEPRTRVIEGSNDWPELSGDGS